MIDLNSLVELQITFIVINETLFLADVCLNVTLTYVNISSANQKLISSWDFKELFYTQYIITIETDFKTNFKQWLWIEIILT